MNVRIRKQGGKTYLGSYQHQIELSETGAFLWSRVDGGRSTGEIGKLLAAEYDIPVPEAVADAAEFFGQLASFEVLTFRADAG